MDKIFKAILNIQQFKQLPDKIQILVGDYFLISQRNPRYPDWQMHRGSPRDVFMHLALFLQRFKQISEAYNLYLTQSNPIAGQIEL